MIQPIQCLEVTHLRDPKSQICIDCYDKFTNSLPDTLTYLEQGLELFDQEHFEEALQLFNKAIQTNQMLASAYYALGEAVRNLSQFEKALFWMSKGDITEQRNIEYFRFKGQTLRKLGRLEEAEDIEKFVKIEELRFQIDQESILKKYQEHQEANKFYSNPISIPQQPREELSKNEYATKEQVQAIKLQEQSKKILNISGHNKGVILNSVIKVLEADQFLERKFQQQPLKYGKHTGLINSYKSDKALHSNDDQLKIPQVQINSNNIGTTLSNQQKYEESKASSDKLIDMNQKDLQQMALYANLLFKEKDFEEAIKFIEESSKNNEDPEIFYKLGIILCKLNRFEESIKSFIKASEKGYDYKKMTAIIEKLKKIKM